MSAITSLSDLASDVESRSFIDTFEEGLRYFRGEGELNKTVAQLGRDLDRHDVEYAVIGAVALTAQATLVLRQTVRAKYLELLEAVERGTSNLFEEQ